MSFPMTVRALLIITIRIKELESERRSRTSQTGFFLAESFLCKFFICIQCDHDRDGDRSPFIYYLKINIDWVSFPTAAF